MNIVQPTPWPTQLSEAIVGFPLWGRLRPHTERGHAITALAFHAWSKGGLGLFSYNAETKTGGRHLYACSFSPSRFEPLLIDWKEGWCATERLSSQRFQEDASRNGSVYSWSAGALPREQADSELQALSKQDQVLVLAMRMHLETQLGAFHATALSKSISQVYNRMVQAAAVKKNAAKARIKQYQDERN